MFPYFCQTEEIQKQELQASLAAFSAQTDRSCSSLASLAKVSSLMWMHNLVKTPADFVSRRPRHPTKIIVGWMLILSFHRPPYLTRPVHLCILPLKWKLQSPPTSACEVWLFVAFRRPGIRTAPRSALGAAVPHAAVVLSVALHRTPPAGKAWDVEAMVLGPPKWNMESLPGN